jgi:hypothetical protein
MKSEERHRLESNWLASHLSKWVDSGMPYGQTVLLTVLGILAVISLWTWYGRSATSQQSEAWLDYNLAVEGQQPSLQMLKRVAADHANSPVGELSEITWADGKVYEAADRFLTAKQSANESLDEAIAKYEEIIEETKDPLLISRSHFGLGRAHEMRADVEKAKAEYEKVSGPFEPLAKQRLEQLNRPQADEALTWLAKAEAPRFAPPAGPGTPGVRPEFGVDDLLTPGVEQEPEPSIEDLFKKIGELGTATPDRYAPPGDQPPPGVTQEEPADRSENPMEESPSTDEPASTTPMAEPAADAPPPEEPDSSDESATDGESESPQP